MLQSRRARITRRIAMSGQQLCAFSTKRLASILAWHWVYAKLAPAVLTSQRNIYARTNTGSFNITAPRGFDIAFYLGTKSGRFVNGANGIGKHRSFDIAASEQSQHRSRKTPRAQGKSNARLRREALWHGRAPKKLSAANTAAILTPQYAAASYRHFSAHARATDAIKLAFMAGL